MGIGFTKYLDEKVNFFPTHCTVWKFQILREINIEESRSSKTAVLPFLGALTFVNLVHFSLLKVQKMHKKSKPLNVLK